MIKVDNFRSFNLYNQSINIAKTIYKVTNSPKSDLNKMEVNLIRKKVLVISNKTASGISQVNMLIRFKKLNQVKVELQQLQVVIKELNKKKKLDKQYIQKFEDYSREFLKLLHGYFGWLNDQKKLV